MLVTPIIKNIILINQSSQSNFSGDYAKREQNKRAHNCARLFCTFSFEECTKLIWGRSLRVFGLIIWQLFIKTEKRGSAFNTNGTISEPGEEGHFFPRFTEFLLRPLFTQPHKRWIKPIILRLNLSYLSISFSSNGVFSNGPVPFPWKMNPRINIRLIRLI